MAGKRQQDNPHINPELLTGDSPFRNCLLVSMPFMHEGAFYKSVIYVCAHNETGAMGIVINQPLPEINFNDLLEQMKLPKSQVVVDPVVHFGGPVETGRGFVLHSTDFVRADTVRINDRMGITGTIDILRAIADGRGPDKSIFALGYAGWGPGQLEAEMRANAWLTIPADDDLMFHTDLGQKWEKALARLGIDPLTLSADSGHA